MKDSVKFHFLGVRLESGRRIRILAREPLPDIAFLWPEVFTRFFIRLNYWKSATQIIDSFAVYELRRLCLFLRGIENTPFLLGISFWFGSSFGNLSSWWKGRPPNFFYARHIVQRDIEKYYTSF
jgi:hypothetical protein